MAPQTGYRLVAHPKPEEDDPTPYSSLVLDVEGALVTEPNAGAISCPGGAYVFTDFAHLAFIASFTSYQWLIAGNTYSKRRVLIVEYDDGDVTATKDLGPRKTRTALPVTFPATYVRDPDPWYRVTVTALEVGDEFTNAETCILSGLSPGGHNSLDARAWDEVLADHGVS